MKGQLKIKATMRIRLQPGKSEYTETEAARALGISQIQFRTLLVRHVLHEETALSNVALMRFRPSDLLLLSMLRQDDQAVVDRGVEVGVQVE